MSKTIIVIDDDAEICELVSLFLNLEGYEVLTASEGMQGLALLRNNSVDLIILDIGLPDISGQQLCRIIRAESTTPIIMLSARDSVADKVLSLDYGADDYITKPFENIELLARIHAVERRWEGRRNQSDGKSTVFHHLVIDSAKRQVTRDGEVVALTPKEYELLVYLAESAGKTLARDKIIEDLWGGDALYKWSRSLDVHIQNLRQKIEIHPKNPEIIKTVTGVGYKVKK